MSQRASQVKLDFLLEIYRDFHVILTPVYRKTSSMKIKNKFLNFLGEDL